MWYHTPCPVVVLVSTGSTFNTSFQWRRRGWVSAPGTRRPWPWTSVIFNLVLRYTGWRLQICPERIQYKLAVLVYKCLNGMEWRRRIWQMSFSSRRTLPPGHGFVRHRHCSFAVHGCRLSATEHFRSLLPVFGTVCRIMSPSHHRCLSTVAAWRVTFSSSPSHPVTSILL